MLQDAAEVAGQIRSGVCMRITSHSKTLEAHVPECIDASRGTMRSTCALALCDAIVVTSKDGVCFAGEGDLHSKDGRAATTASKVQDVSAEPR
eukprot:175772-Amphidinium_carterae.1